MCRSTPTKASGFIAKKPDLMLVYFYELFCRLLRTVLQALMNRFERAPLLPGEAVVQYLDGDMKVMRPGHFVRCAVTGASIALEELRYWSVEKQEAYATREAVLQSIGAITPDQS